MGMHANNLSFLRYTVLGEVPPDFVDNAALMIEARAFRDIDDSTEDQSIGWVSAWNMFSSDLSQPSSFLLGDHIVLTLRLDERKVSQAVLKKCVQKEEERLRRERSIQKLNKFQRQEIRDAVQAGLMKRVVPAPSCCDLAWNLADNTLYLFSTAVKFQSLLEDLFYKTFGLRLLLQIPYTIAKNILSPDDAGRLDRLLPTVFMEPSPGL